MNGLRATWGWVTALLGCCTFLGGAEAAELSVPPGLTNITWTGEIMGSFYYVRLAQVRLEGEALQALKTEVRERLEALNNRVSNFIPSSELSRFNKSTSSAPFKISSDFVSNVRFSLVTHAQTGGAFDPTLGPLIRLWGFGEGSYTNRAPAAAARGLTLLPEEATTIRTNAAPSPAAVKAALACCGAQHLRLTERDELIKDIPGLQINLGGVAKGYGVDVMARVLWAHGLSNFMVQISGETYVSGRSPRGGLWRVGIDTPEPGLLPGQSMEAVVNLTDQAFSTSGDYRKFFVDETGRRRCHILDPRTGEPVSHSLGSVSVVASDCTTADAYATALFVMGAEQGMRWIETRTNAAALFIVRQPQGHFELRASRRFPPFEKRPE